MLPECTLVNDLSLCGCVRQKRNGLRARSPIKGFCASARSQHIPSLGRNLPRMVTISANPVLSLPRPLVDFDRWQKPALIQIQCILSEKLFGAKLLRNHLLIDGELHDRLDKIGRAHV